MNIEMSTKMNRRHIVKDSARANYEGKFLIVNPKYLRDRYKNAEGQLVFAYQGFGCFPHLGGNAVFVTDINGNSERWGRHHFLGIAKDKAVDTLLGVNGKRGMDIDAERFARIIERVAGKELDGLAVWIGKCPSHFDSSDGVWTKLGESYTWWGVDWRGAYSQLGSWAAALKRGHSDFFSEANNE